MVAFRPAPAGAAGYPSSEAPCSKAPVLSRHDVCGVTLYLCVSLRYSGPRAAAVIERSRDPFSPCIHVVDQRFRHGPDLSKIARYCHSRVAFECDRPVIMSVRSRSASLQPFANTMPGLSPPTIQRQSHADMETTDLNSLTLSDAPRFPPLTRRAVDACAFPSWYPTFRRVSPKATTIPLTAQFIEYLHADGVFLPTNGEDSGS